MSQQSGSGPVQRHELQVDSDGKYCMRCSCGITHVFTLTQASMRKSADSTDSALEYYFSELAEYVDFDCERPRSVSPRVSTSPVSTSSSGSASPPSSESSQSSVRTVIPFRRTSPRASLVTTDSLEGCDMPSPLRIAVKPAANTDADTSPNSNSSSSTRRCVSRLSRPFDHTSTGLAIGSVAPVNAPANAPSNDHDPTLPNPASVRAIWWRPATAHAPGARELSRPHRPASDRLRLSPASQVSFQNFYGRVRTVAFAELTVEGEEHRRESQRVKERAFGTGMEGCWPYGFF